MRLFVALDVAKYYEMTSRDLCPTNMLWNVLKNFEVQHKALKEKKEKNPPEVPRYSKNMGVPKWVESFKIHLRAIIGVQGVPLAYVIREIDMVAVIPPPLAIDQPHSEEHGTVEDELIARTSHSHPLYMNDNGEVFDILETALRNTVFSATIVHFRKSRNGRGAYLSLVSQHAGDDVWQQTISSADEYLKNRRWSGTSGHTLCLPT